MKQKRIPAKAPRKNWFSIYDMAIASGFNIAFYTHQSTFLSKKLNVEKKINC